MKRKEQIINEIVDIDYQILDYKLESELRRVIEGQYPELKLSERAVEIVKPLIWREYCQKN